MPATRSFLSFVTTVFAAFLTYFCMYGYRKPFTAAKYEEPFGDMSFKEILVIAQVLGYMLSKFVGIKIVSETPPSRRALGILILMVLAELSLVLLGVLPRPWSCVALFLNGLALGMVFGLVVGFLEGRQSTEALSAGLCTSFIVADGVTKTVGRWLLDCGITENWMPAVAGLIYATPLLIGIGLLQLTPRPNDDDIRARSERTVLTKSERWQLVSKYRWGLGAIVFVFMIVTILRSFRADFGPELWQGLTGKNVAPDIFTYSELAVAFGILIMNGASVLIRDNAKAFFLSLMTCGLGFVLLAVWLIGWRQQWLSPFAMMVGLGMSLYLPYVAIHTTVFERFLATTREKGNLGFLLTFADAFGYLSYVSVVLVRRKFNPGDAFLNSFLAMSWIGIGLCATAIIVAIVTFWYSLKSKSSE